MVFEKDKKNMTYYHTPFGSLMMGIDAKEISVQETEQEIHAQVQYALDINYEHLADCTITYQCSPRMRLVLQFMTE